MKKFTESLRSGVMHRLLMAMLMLLACVGMMQAQTAVTYRPAEGKSGNELVPNSYGHYSMQAAHEDWNIIYAKAGTISLKRRNDTFNAYARWYNYNTNGTMAALTPSETADYTSANGVFRTRDNGSVDAFTASYVYDGQSTVRIACDQSAYSDYDLTDGVLTEPTISQRIIYEIRPASEMAHRVDGSTSAFLEEYNIIAPTGQTIYLGPQYTFNSQGSYPSYFFNESAPSWMNTTAFTGSSSSSTIGEWEGNVTSNQTTVVYKCINAYSEPSSRTGSVKMNRTSAVPNSMSGNFELNGYTWNYKRTYVDTDKNGVAPAYVTLLGMKFGDTGKNNTGENVVFTVSGIPGTIKSVVVKGSSVPSDGKTGNTHTVSVKVGGTRYGTDEAMSLITDEYQFSGNSTGSLEISFTARKRRSALYIKSIVVNYEIAGSGQSYALGAELTEEPSASFRNFWKKVETQVVATDWKKIDVESSGNSAGWNWIVDNVAQSSPTTFSGQFIKATSSTVGTHTYQLTYTDGGGATTTTTYTKSDEVTTVTEYNYVNGWTQSSQTPTTVITVPESHTTVTTGGNGGSGSVFKIAKFTVNYMDKTKVGPYLITDYAYLDATEKIAGQDFNFNVPGTTSTTYYTHPLSTEESTFGFYYGSSTDRTQKYTFWNEYCFVNSGFGYTSQTNMANHVGNSDGTDATKGYALYTDGSQKPGTVFSLNFDAELCAGAKMYFSAWIGDQNAGGNNPSIFDFIVVGVDAAGNETNLTIFTTGEFKGSGWKRILFPLDFNSNVDFEKYLLRVVNKAATTTGNDFFIDDIAVYLQKAPIVPIQASTPSDKCIDIKSDLVLYTRVDYAEVATEASEGSTRQFYYRWINEAGEPIITDKYLNPVSDKSAGTIIVPENQSAIEATGSTYDHSDADFATFDARHNQTTAPLCRFIKEKCTNSDGTVSNRYVVYVATPIEAQLGVKYKCVIASAVEDLGANNDCSSSAVVEISNGMRINSVKMGGMVKTFDQSACANYSYDLSLVVEYAVQSGSTTVNKSCSYLAHWLFGKEPETAAEQTAFLALFGASFDDIEDALTARNSDETTPAQDALITRLVQKGLLILAETLDQTNPVYNVTPLVTNEEVSYTAFPVRRLCDDAPECNDPKSLTLFFESNDGLVQRNAVYFVKNHSETGVPQFVLSRPRRVRVLEKTDSRTVLLDLTDPANTYRMKSIVLYATDDPARRASVNKDAILTFKPVSAAGAEQDVVSNLTDGILFSGLAALAPGRSYTFKLGYELLTHEEGKQECVDEKGNKHDGEAFITFLIVPELLTFANTAVTDAWNDDYNWLYADGDVNRTVFAPLEGTSVIFRTGDHILLNRTAAQFQESALEPAALPYISFDINYQPYTCNNVYVPAGTAITGQSNVDAKGKWTLDMPVVPGKWIMTSMPIKGVVSGDMFIPASGEDEKDVFAVKAITQVPGQAAQDRIVNRFYNSLYNKVASQKDVTGSVDITSSTWTLATNSLNTPFGPGYGWALGFDGEATDRTIRLPKVDDEYHFFRNDAWLGMSENITRTDVGKAAYQTDAQNGMTVTLTNNTESEIFLLGNPTFGYIDLAALQTANPSITAFYQAGLAGGRYSLVTSKPANGTWASTLPSYEDSMLAPLHSVFVRAPQGTSLNVRITDDMLRTKAGKHEVNGVMAVPAAPGLEEEEQEQKAIYLSAEALDFRSTAAVFENADASDDATDEDVELYTLDKTKTPFAIFTIASGKALAINNICDAEIIPLAMFSEKDLTSLNLTFAGADAYLADWDLIDNQSSLRQALSDSLSLSLEMPANGAVRYYLEHARHTFDMRDALDDADLSVRAFSDRGYLTVFSDADMTDFRIYDASGRLILAEKNAGQLLSTALPTGVYVVRTRGEVLKVIVK